MKGPLAVVCCHFNPCGYLRPVQNYYRFRDHMRALDVPVYAVELTYDQDLYVLSAEKSIWTSRSRGLMWQKERLLNVAIDDIIDEYDNIAWIDPDVYFVKPTVIHDTLKELQSYDIIQMFSDSYWADEHGEITHAARSTGFWWSAQSSLWKDFNQSHPGFAWAARSDVLRRAGGLYDKFICTGGADTYMTSAFTGQLTGLENELSVEVEKDFNQWKLRLGCVSTSVVMGAVIHSFHGRRHNRRYAEKRGYGKDFDPVVHIRRAGDVYEWTDAGLHYGQKIKELLEKRREDG